MVSKERCQNLYIPLYMLVLLLRSSPLSVSPYFSFLSSKLLQRHLLLEVFLVSLNQKHWEIHSFYDKSTESNKKLVRVRESLILSLRPFVTDRRCLNTASEPYQLLTPPPLPWGLPMITSGALRSPISKIGKQSNCRGFIRILDNIHKVLGTQIFSTNV